MGSGSTKDLSFLRMCVTEKQARNMSDKFNLTYNDFQTNVVRSFSSLRRDSALCDVTLVTDDHKQVRAHKIVLATCSEFFQTIFQNSPSHSSQLMLYLSDFSSDDLHTILDYIYLGEARMFQEGLDKFLNLAQKLKLEGLLGPKDEETLDQDTRHHKENEEKHIVLGQTHMEIPSSSSNQANSFVKMPRTINKAATTGIVSRVAFDGNMDIEELNQKILEYTRTEGDKCICTLCGKESTGKNKKQNLAKHIETHFEGLSFICQLCGKTYRSRNALAIHLSYNHNLKK